MCATKLFMCQCCKLSKYSENLDANTISKQSTWGCYPDNGNALRRSVTCSFQTIIQLRGEIKVAWFYYVLLCECLCFINFPFRTDPWKHSVEYGNIISKCATGNKNGIIQLTYSFILMNSSAKICKIFLHFWWTVLELIISVTVSFKSLCNDHSSYLNYARSRLFDWLTRSFAITYPHLRHF